MNDHMREMEVLVYAATGSELRKALETRNIPAVGRIVATASLLRQESRGCFWRIDHPEPDNANWLENIVISRGAEGIETRVERAVITRLTEPTTPRLRAGCLSYIER